MLKLVQMPRSEALEPLCRLIRFEKSALVAKQGALAIMLQSEPAETAWPQQAKQILHALSGSDRAPARWLRNYVHSHDDPEAALADWDKLVTEELAPSPTRPIRKPKPSFRICCCGTTPKCCWPGSTTIGPST